MSSHIALTSAVITLSSGTYGYLKTKSRPSLLGGLALTSMFLSATYMIKKTDNQVSGHSLAALAGTLALVIGAKRLKTTNFAFGIGPISLITVGILNVPYQYMKAFEFYQTS